MRQIQLQLETKTPGNPSNPFDEYAEIRNGEVRITNAVHAVKFPQKEIFGATLFDSKKVWYFRLKDWKEAKAWRASSIEFDPVNEWLVINDQTSVFTTVKLIDQFDLGFIFPSIKDIWPSTLTEQQVYKGWGLNAFELFTLQRILIPGENYEAMKLDKLRIRCVAKDKYLLSYCGGKYQARALLMGWAFNPDIE